MIKYDPVESCKSMAQSIIAYNWFPGMDGEDIVRYEENNYHNYLEDYIKQLGRATVVSIVNDVIDRVDHIERNVYRDGEGVTYNSIVWKEISL